MLWLFRVGPCDVTKKEDLEKLVQDISKKEKYISLLSLSTFAQLVTQETNMAP